MLKTFCNWFNGEKIRKNAVLRSLIEKYYIDDKDNPYYQKSSYKLQISGDRYLLGLQLGRSSEDRYDIEKDVEEKLFLNILFHELFWSDCGYLTSSLCHRLITVYPKLNKQWKQTFDTIIISPAMTLKIATILDYDRQNSLRYRVLSEEQTKKMKDLFF